MSFVTVNFCYRSTSICATASNVREKTASEPIVAMEGLPEVDVDSEILEKTKTFVIVRQHNIKILAKN